MCRDCSIGVTIATVEYQRFIGRRGNIHSEPLQLPYKNVSECIQDYGKTTVEKILL